MECCTGECEAKKYVLEQERGLLKQNLKSCKGEIRLYRKMLSLMVESGKVTKKEISAFRREAKKINKKEKTK